MNEPMKTLYIFNMQRFCWRERCAKLNWRLLSALNVSEVIRRGDPAMLEPYALHVTFARLPVRSRDVETRDAWYLVRLLQLSMEYLLFMRNKDSKAVVSLSQELQQVEVERDGLLLYSHKWKARARSGEKQVEKLHQVLQNIAKLLQIHGASPSAVATIETLLTELIVERRAKLKRHKMMEENDDEDERDKAMKPDVKEARVCRHCGKVFSSAKYLEMHLVRRHNGESNEMEMPIKPKMRRDDGENREYVDETVKTQAKMQNMVRQMERALQDHEKKLRSLAEDEAKRVKLMHEQLHFEAKQAEELKVLELKEKLRLEEAQRQLDGVNVQKDKAEKELLELKHQIQNLTVEKKMTEAATTVVLSIDGALVNAKKTEESNDPIQTLEALKAELMASREELTKVQALYLSTLKRKKKLADTLASLQGKTVAAKRDQSSQTKLPERIQMCVQLNGCSNTQPSTDEISSKMKTPSRKDTGTDPMTLGHEDVGIQTVDLVAPPLEELQMKLSDDSTSTLKGSEMVEASVNAEDATSLKPIEEKVDECISDYIHQIHRQDLLDLLAARAERAASKAATNSQVCKSYSSLPRHKYVRSRYQHDESKVKERVARCFLQLEQVACRFGIPAKTPWLAEDSAKHIQHALYGHLETLPSQVLAKMVDCENIVNKLIEEEWAPMEKTRQQALERYKMETRAKSERNQGLVRQAMAAFGAPLIRNEANDSEIPEGSAVMEVKVNEVHVQDSVADTEAPKMRGAVKKQPIASETSRVGASDLAAVTEKSKLLSPSDNEVALVSAAVNESARNGDEKETIDQKDHSADPTLTARSNGSEPSRSFPPVAPFPLENSPKNAASLTTFSGSSALSEVPRTVAHKLPSTMETRLLLEAPMNQPAATITRQSSPSEANSSRTNYSGTSIFTATASRTVNCELETQQSKGSVQGHVALVAAHSTSYDQVDTSILPQPLDDVQPVQSSTVSVFSVVSPATELERTLSVAASSDISFSKSITSLQSESLDATIDVVKHEVTGDARDSAACSAESIPAVTQENQTDNVMVFDDSDIEEIVLQ